MRARDQHHGVLSEDRWDGAWSSQEILTVCPSFNVGVWLLHRLPHCGSRLDHGQELCPRWFEYGEDFHTHLGCSVEVSFTLQSIHDPKRLIKGNSESRDFYETTREKTGGSTSG